MSSASSRATWTSCRCAFGAAYAPPACMADQRACGLFSLCSDFCVGRAHYCKTEHRIWTPHKNNAHRTTDANAHSRTHASTRTQMAPKPHTRMHTRTNTMHTCTNENALHTTIPDTLLSSHTRAIHRRTNCNTPTHVNRTRPPSGVHAHRRAASAVAHDRAAPEPHGPHHRFRRWLAHGAGHAPAGSRGGCERCEEVFWPVSCLSYDDPFVCKGPDLFPLAQTHTGCWPTLHAMSPTQVSRPPRACCCPRC
jgi:hypothetical protein